MYRQQFLRRLVGVAMVMLLLVGCGAPATAPITEVPAATSASEQAPTPTPELPTATSASVPPTSTVTHREPETDIPGPLTQTPELATAPSTPELPTERAAEAPVEVPAKTIQGLLLDANTGEPLSGQFEAVVGWDLEKDPQAPGGVKGNMIFIEGRPQGNLTVGANGKFTLKEVDYPLYLDVEFRFQTAEKGQPLMMAIRGGSLKDAKILENEIGESMVFQIEEGNGVDLGKVYAMP